MYTIAQINLYPLGQNAVQIITSAPSPLFYCVASLAAISTDMGVVVRRNWKTLAAHHSRGSMLQCFFAFSFLTLCPRLDLVYHRCNHTGSDPSLYSYREALGFVLHGADV